MEKQQCAEYDMMNRNLTLTNLRHRLSALDP